MFPKGSSAALPEEEMASDVLLTALTSDLCSAGERLILVQSVHMCAYSELPAA